MKTLFTLISTSLAAALLAGCGAINTFSPTQFVTPSANIISETRQVSGITGVDMRTFGDVTISQGRTETLVVKGSDNLVALVKTSVQNGVLVIEMNHVSLQSANAASALSFDLTVKSLDSLTVSGLSSVAMTGLDSRSLNVTMNGAGAIKIAQLKAESVSANINGLGGISLAGTSGQIDVNISGAGDINAGALKCQKASAALSGLGSATLWVTDDLSGTISGAGSVHYYGSPSTNTQTTGVGKFESLGNK